MKLIKTGGHAAYSTRSTYTDYEVRDENGQSVARFTLRRSDHLNTCKNRGEWKKETIKTYATICDQSPADMALVLRMTGKTVAECEKLGAANRYNYHLKKEFKRLIASAE